VANIIQIDARNRMNDTILFVGSSSTKKIKMYSILSFPRLLRLLILNIVPSIQLRLFLVNFIFLPERYDFI
jgi:hypothetical protein